MIQKAPFYVWQAAVTLASLLPSAALPDTQAMPLGADKVVHIFMYTILAFLARPALISEHHDHFYRRILGVVSGIIIYGMLLEILQPLLSSRSFEWTDILANTAGVLCGTLLWRQEQKTRLT